jgi:MFS family permease
VSVIPRFTVLRHRNYRLLFAATLGSGLGTWMATVALTVDVANRTHSTWWISALLLVTFMPSVIVGLVAGPLVDRLSRKKLVIWSDLVRLAVFAVLPFANDARAIVVLAAVAGFANSFFRPAVLAGLPNLVEAPHLDSATSLLQGTDWLAAAAGPVLGGAIVSLSSADVVYGINAATFLFSALLLLRIPARLLQSEQGITRGHWRDLGDGIAEYRRSRPLAVAFLAFALTQLATGVINGSEIFLATRSFHSGAFGYGLLGTATGVGLVAGSILTGVILESRELLRVYPLAFLPCTVGVAAAAIAPNVWAAALGMVVAGFGNGLAFPMTVLLVQRNTSDRMRGRAFTLIISGHNALLGLAFIAAGALTETAGPRWAFGIAALLTLGSACTAYALGRRT